MSCYSVVRIGSGERPLECVPSGHEHLLVCFFNSLKWKRQAKELVGAWVTRQIAPDSGKMGPWHAVLEVLVLLDLQHVGLPFWHITKPTRYKENPNLDGILTPWSVNVRRNLNP